MERIPPDPRCSLLVLPGYSDSPEYLLGVAQRLAASMNVPWSLVHVQSARFRFRREHVRTRQAELERMAGSLGGSAVVLHDNSTEHAIAAYARLSDSGTILVGAPSRPGLRTVASLRQLARLRREAPNVDITAVAAPGPARQPSEQLKSSEPKAPPRHGRWSRYAGGLLITAICTAISFPLAAHVDLINVAMLYIVGMAGAGLWLGRAPSALVAVANTLAFDYFFVPPVFSFDYADARYLVTFAVMLLVGLIIANLMIVVRRQTEAAGIRERHTAALYAATRSLTGLRDTRSMAELAVQRIAEELQCRCTILLCAENGRLESQPIAASRGAALVVDSAAAEWAISHRVRTGAGARVFESLPAIYLPLLNAHTTLGVLVTAPADPGMSLHMNQVQLLEALGGQLASALERARLTELAHAAHVEAERAAMRNTMLASISHDLRTPLSAIAGAGSIVAQHDFSLDVYRRVMLGRLIEDKARNMSELLSNVLELVRLESGFDKLNCDWHTLSDLIGLAIQRHETRLSGWDIATDVADDFPLLWVDATLVVQLLGNLLENAAKYTPARTRITIAGRARADSVHIVVEDEGPGWATEHPEHLFERFARTRSGSAASGFGLGLAICKAVTRLHGGEIRAVRGRTGGARIEIDMPMREADTAALAAAESCIS